MKYNESAYAKCPFYHKEAPQRVFCEGVVDKSSLTLNFSDAEQCQDYRFRYCNAIYETCPVFEMLTKKYKEG